MTKEELLNVQSGQKVRIISLRDDFEEPDFAGIFKQGDILIRSERDWLDDDECLKFEKEEDGHYHWFYSDEIELIEVSE